MTRNDPELGPTRRCVSCSEWWPDEREFFEPRYASCNACRAERCSGARIRTVKATALLKRKAPDPLGEVRRRARWRAASARYYQSHRPSVIDRQRARYAARLDRPLHEGFGRPRVAA